MNKISRRLQSGAAALLAAFALSACEPHAAGKPQIPVPAHAAELASRDIQIGTGATAGPHSQVTLHYTGWVYAPAAPDGYGIQFDSSRGDELNPPLPFSFTLGANQVIPGWDQGIVGMKAGGRRILLVPPQLAYGERGAGRGKIPPHATLIFDIELLAVK